MPDINKAKMTPREREIRSRLAQLVSRAALARGNLSERKKVCGKLTCRCAAGHKHQALYLVASELGKPRQLFIPKKMEREARECVEVYRKIRELLEELSQIYWQKLKQRVL